MPSLCSCASARSRFAGFRFPPDMIIVAIRWYLRYLRRVIDELLPAACHVTKQYANNAVEATFRPR